MQGAQPIMLYNVENEIMNDAWLLSKKSLVKGTKEETRPYLSFGMDAEDESVFVAFLGCSYVEGEISIDGKNIFFKPEKAETKKCDNFTEEQMALEGKIKETFAKKPVMFFGGDYLVVSGDTKEKSLYWDEKSTLTVSSTKKP